MKNIPFLILTFLLFTFAFPSCKNDKSATQVFNFGVEPYDSTALHLALIPNKDCLPIYYAERSGIYDSLGLKLQIATYSSQMDCDTTLMGEMADGGWADPIRISHFGKKMQNLKVMWNGTTKWFIFASERLRVSDVKALEGRTVAIARTSAEADFLDKVLTENKCNKDKVYQPLINDLRLRTLMLSGNQIDAAVLAWPYTSLASANKHKCIYSQRNSVIYGCFTMKSNRLRKQSVKQQWDLLEKGRKMALDSFKIKGPKAYSIILQKDYGLPREVADTVQWF